MEELLLEINRLLQRNSAVPYLVIEDSRVVATWEYFCGVYKKDATRIRSTISDYLAGKQMEREKNFNDNTRNTK